MDALDRHFNQLAYEERGSGVPVVFIHGLTFSRRTWAPILDLLSSRFRCVAIDLPGHGQSGGLPRSLDEAAQRIHALMAHLGIEPPVVVGHSMGGLEATIYAATFPVSGVVNVDQSLAVQPFVHVLHQLEPALRGPQFAAAFEPIRQQIGVEMLPEPLRTATYATQTVRQDLVLAYWNDVFGNAAEAVQSRLDEAISRITVPYLAVFGHRLDDRERSTLRAQLPGLELEEWADLVHMVHLMEPDRFAQRLGTFIDRCSAS